MEWVEVIQTLGFPIACVVACAYFIYYVSKRWMDESKERETKLIEANTKNSDALVKVADTIEKTNEINKSLMDKLDTKIDRVEQDIQKIIDIVDK